VALQAPRPGPRDTGRQQPGFGFGLGGCSCSSAAAQNPQPRCGPPQHGAGLRAALHPCWGGRHQCVCFPCSASWPSSTSIIVSAAFSQSSPPDFATSCDSINGTAPYLSHGAGRAHARARPAPRSRARPSLRHRPLERALRGEGGAPHSGWCARSGPTSYSNTSRL